MLLEKTPKSSLTARSSNQSILREINPEYSLEGLLLKLNCSILVIWCKQLTHWKKSLMLGKIDGRRKRGHQRMQWLDGITNAMDMNLGKLQEMVRVRKAWPTTVHGVAKSWRKLGNWKTTIERPLLQVRLSGKQTLRWDSVQNVYYGAPVNNTCGKQGKSQLWCRLNSLVWPHWVALEWKWS